jgi:hypothetical protein
MSKVGIQLKIDVSKIDKALLYKGAKGIYLDATVFVELDQADQYGNHGMITQNETKENRDAGKNGAILGNCKVFWKEQSQAQGRQPAQQHSNHGKPAPQALNQPPAGYDDFDDDIPFN